MSEQNELKQIDASQIQAAPGVDINEVIRSNQQMAGAVQTMQGQVNFLTHLLQGLVPKPGSPNYPTTAMPAEPKIPGLGPQPEDVARIDGEGVPSTMPDWRNSPVPPPPHGVKRIMIGVPMLAVSYEFFESFLKFWTELCVKKDSRYEITYLFAYRKPVHMAEEWLIKQALFNKCTHVLLMDDDIYDVTKADLDKLVEADKDMISGVMHASKFPHAACTFRRYDRSKRVIDMPADNSMYRLYEIPATCPSCSHGQTHWDVKFCPNCGVEIDISVQPVDLVPFPFTLFKLDMFKDKIKQPWFHCTNGYPTDSWFCDRMLEAGLQPYAHMLIRLNHAGVTDETKPLFMQMGMVKMGRNKAVVNLTPEVMDVHQTLLHNKMHEVEQSIKPKPPIIGVEGLVANELNPKDLTLITHERKS